MVNLSVSNIAWDKINDDIIYENMKKLKFKGLEIAPTRIFPHNPYDKCDDLKVFYKDLYDKYGFIICSMQSIWYGRSEGIFNSVEERKSLIEYSKKMINFANSAGIKNIVFGCPKNRNIKGDFQYSIAYEFFGQLGNYAESKDTVISIEPNPPIYGTNFINTTKEAFDFVKKIDMAAIKVNIDLGTIIENKESVKMILDNINLINHIHISEPNLLKIQKREMHKELKNILDSVDYKKFVSIEMKNNNNINDIIEVMYYIGGVFNGL